MDNNLDASVRLFKSMNLTSAKSPKRCAWQLCRVIISALCVSVLTATPVLADTVRLNQVVQTLASSQGSPDLKLNSLVSQDPVTPGSQSAAPQTGPRNDSQASAQGPAKTDSIISNVTVTSEGQQIGVEIVDEGEVEGTICDCGELLIAGAAFPKWPFLFLGIVPLVFINDCDDCDEPHQEEPTPTPTPTPTPPTTPTPTPTPTEVPEPASLLLFGTGLAVAGAGLRRRYAKSKVAEQVKGQEEE
jgi:hypothetical protein